MLSVLFQCLTLALASITPTMVVFVAALLPAHRGPVKAMAVVLGRFVAHFAMAWLFVFVLSTQIDDLHLGEEQNALLSGILVIAGAVLLMLAGRMMLSDEDVEADRPPTKLAVLLDSVSPLTLGVANVVIVLFSLRLMVVCAAGAAIIVAANLRPSEEIIAIVVLAGSMVLSLSLPVIIYFGLGSRGPVVVGRMGVWMKENQRYIQIAIFLLFGFALLIKGIG